HARESVRRGRARGSSADDDHVHAIHTWPPRPPASARLTAPPTIVQIAFTASLVIHATPPANRVALPQRWTIRSVAAEQLSHQRRCCQRAPSKESATEPAIPPANAAAASAPGSSGAGAIAARPP